MRGEIHRFFCIGCGKEGIPLFRRAGFEKSSLHRKKLYCAWCKQTVNHVEIRNDQEKESFLESFAQGAFLEEFAESVEYIKKEGCLL